MLQFYKMHGLGNDFVIIDGRKENFTPEPLVLRTLADRRTGIGFDQFILLLPARQFGADLFMAIYNADGTSAGACGNATRCVARLIFEETGRERGVIETWAGLMPVWREAQNRIGVDFARPSWDWQKIPLAQACDTERLDLTVGMLRDPCAVSMGNPHVVFFVNGVDHVPLEVLGPQIERHPLFPERTNVEIVQIMAPDRLRMRVWERGTGITPACGSGACAALVAAARRGLAGRKAEILLDGGVLTIEWRDDDRVIMTGPATMSYRGIIAPELLTGAAVLAG